MKKKTNQLYVSVAKNSFIDHGDGRIEFKNGLTITDNNEQHNGTKYDIASMDISEFSEKLTADHKQEIEAIIGKVVGTRKVANRRVVIEAIQFAVEENALARFAYNMMLGGFLTDFSIETIGPWPDDDGVYHDSKLVGLSAVVMGNNKSAKINSALSEIYQHTINSAKNDGLDTSIVENKYACYDNNNSENNKEDDKNKEKNMLVAVKNTRKFPVTVSYKNSAGDEVELTLQSGQSFDVSSDQADALKKQINDASEPAKEEANAENAVSATDMAKIINEAVAPLTQKIQTLEKQAFDAGAREPEFRKAEQAKISNKLSGMGWRERHGQQINHAWNALKGGDASALKKLADINAFHLEDLQKAGLVPNTITIADMGNFVISREMLSEIEGHRSDFRPLLDKLDWRETLSTQMAWLSRSGDINMQEVEMCDDDADGNLKPISEYGATINLSNLHELAAVTPVCNAATRFLAADLLGDVAQGYRTDYDRKRAQLFIARLQQAVNANGHVATYGTTSDVSSLKSWVDMVAEISEEINNGVFILSNASRWEMIKTAISSGISGDILAILKSGDMSPILGAPAIVVPNELLPKLNTADTKSFTVEGASVSITHAVFYTDLSTFSGRTSGGLQFDLSTDAAYEVDSVVKSAFQRNELVLRGSFFRGGAVRDQEKVAAMGAPGVS